MSEREARQALLQASVVPGGLERCVGLRKHLHRAYGFTILH